MRDKERAEPRPFLAAHSLQGRECLTEGLHDAGVAGLPRLLAQLLLLDRLDDAAHGEQAIEPRRRRLDLALELPQKNEELIEHLAIDADARRLLATGHGELNGDVAPLAMLGHRGAGWWLERLEAQGQAAADIEVAAVDALHLPRPVQTSLGPLPACKPGHAGDRQESLQGRTAIYGGSADWRPL